MRKRETERKEKRGNGKSDERSFEISDSKLILSKLIIANPFGFFVLYSFVLRVD